VGTMLILGLTFLLGPISNAQLAQGAGISIAVLGLSLLTGWSGQVSLGNSGFLLIGGYTAGIWAQHHTHSPIIVTLLLAAVTGAIAGVILGLPATRLRGPYLAGMTIAFAVVLPTFVQNLSSISGGFSGLSLSFTSAPGWFTSWFSGPYASQNADAQWTVDCVILVAAFAFIVMGNLFHSKVGRSMRLVRDNEVAAELMGVNVARTRVLAFAISASFASVAGALLVIPVGTVVPQSFPFALSIELLTITVLGGMGTLTGAVMAGFIYAYSGSFVTWFSSNTHIGTTSQFGKQMNSILFAAVLILTMIFAPRGLAGALSDLWRMVTGGVKRSRGTSTTPVSTPAAPLAPALDGNSSA
jgi:branched-chain amino acid transport system permease protein